MAFGFVGDEKANALESEMKEQRIIEAKTQMHQCGIKTKVLRLFFPLAD